MKKFLFWNLRAVHPLYISLAVAWKPSFSIEICIQMLGERNNSIRVRITTTPQQKPINKLDCRERLCTNKWDQRFCRSAGLPILHSHLSYSTLFSICLPFDNIFHTATLSLSLSLWFWLVCNTLSQAVTNAFTHVQFCPRHYSKGGNATNESTVTTCRWLGGPFNRNWVPTSH